MSGPMGGQPGAIPRGGKGHGKGGFPSKRKMPLKGLRKGLYILVSYREKKAPGMLDEKVDYEGTIVDKRVGWDNRESYVELEDCLRLNAEGEIVAKEGKKRLFDAFIDDCEEVEKVERPLSAQLAAQTALAARRGGADGTAATAPAMGMGLEGMSGAGGMMPAMAMGAGMPMGMMPMMGMMGMGGMPMGMMPMPMMGMMPMGAGMPMGMMAMPMMGMGGTTPGAAGGGGGCMMPMGMMGMAAAASTAPRPRSRSRSRG